MRPPVVGGDVGEGELENGGDAVVGVMGSFGRQDHALAGATSLVRLPKRASPRLARVPLEVR